jgi:hypothetical protein
MTLVKTGGVSINGIQFSTDPDPYEHLIWPKRHSVHKTIGGGQIIQDFGMFATDNSMKLGSGNQNYMDGVTMQAIDAIYRTRGITYTLLDYLGNNFEVFITSFIPTILKRGGDIDQPSFATTLTSPYSPGNASITVGATSGFPVNGQPFFIKLGNVAGTILRAFGYSGTTVFVNAYANDSAAISSASVILVATAVDLYRYTMDLQLTSISRLFGQPYSGA